MDILYISNEKMGRSSNLEAIFNKICTINNKQPYVVDNSIYSKFLDGLNNNVFLLSDKTRKIMAF